MANWIRFSASNSITTVGAHANNEITDIHNQSDNIFEDQDLFIVDGFVHIQTDTDDLCGVRLLVIPEEMTTSNISDVTPQENSPLIKYSWWCSRGPLPYRIRSIIRIPPQHEVWITSWKEQGANATVINVGARFLIVAKG